MIKTIDGALYTSMVVSGANLLEIEKERINALNVFPVPDGDTGSNMSMTIGSVRDSAGKTDASIAKSAASVAKTMLMAARGNSGVILSLFFKGLARGFEGIERADAQAVAEAFSKGVEAAYGAVMNPTEGTILTVMRVCAEEGKEKAKNEYKDDPEGLIIYMLSVASETLAKTREMLPALKSAGVVDAGGAGFVCILDGMKKAVAGDAVEYTGAVSSARSSAAFEEIDPDSIKFAYCTEFIVEKNDTCTDSTASELKEFLGGIGDSVVFAEDESIIKVHVHTNEPGVVLTRALELGALVTTKIENMKKQHTALVSESEAKAPTAKYGFLAVANGRGVCDTFTNLGVNEIVSGGQTMNPSIESIVNSIKKINAENVYVFPNNSNVKLAAQMAAQSIEDKNVIVIPTKSFPQGVTCLLNFSEDADVEENTTAMTEAIDTVTTISITYAVHDSDINGLGIKKGQMLGLLGGEVVVAKDTSVSLIDHFAPQIAEASYITLYTGKDSDSKSAAAILAKIKGYAPSAEMIEIDGDQDVYSYIISLE